MDSLSYSQFNVICRACLSKCDIKFKADATISNIFYKLTDLEFEANDLPQQICLKCFDKINEICAFSFQCKRSYSVLLECLNQQENQAPKIEIVNVKSHDISDEIEDEIKKETTSNYDIFESVDKLKTEELKENILILEPDVTCHESENHVIEEDEGNETISKISLKSDERPYKCAECTKTFKAKSHLLLHKSIHSDERPYKCEQCSKAFKHQTTLVQHKRIHSGERPYECGQCSKTFNQQASLVRHERIHTGERPFKCDQCAKAFKNQSHLMEHKLTHSGERLYECDQCPKAFKQSSSLLRHKQQTHAAEWQYKCDLCLKTFSCIENLNEHVKIHIKTIIE